MSYSVKGPIILGTPVKRKKNRCTIDEANRQSRESPSQGYRAAGRGVGRGRGVGGGRGKAGRTTSN
jgi:hypothetical protein